MATQQEGAACEKSFSEGIWRLSAEDGWPTIKVNNNIKIRNAANGT